MSAFNIFLLVVAIVAGVLGFVKGFMRQIGSLAGIVAGVVACRLYGADAAQWLARVAGSDGGTAVTVCAYAGLFVLAYLACVLAATLLRKVLGALSLGIADRLAGAALKIVVWAMLVSVGLNVWVALAPDSRPQGVWAQRVEQLAPTAIGMAGVQLPHMPAAKKN